MDEQSKIAGSNDPVSRLCEFQDSLLWDHFYSGLHTEYPNMQFVIVLPQTRLPGVGVRLIWVSGVRRELRARMQ